MRFSFLLVLLIITSSVKSQVSNIDSIYGNIKRVREKVFDISNKDNPRQIEIDEYSDSMILIPNSLNLTIYDSSFSGSQSGYENYEQFYNENGKIVKHIWYVKKDDFYKSTSYQYDKKNRVIKEIDSSSNYVSYDKHYYEDFDNYTNENIISLNLESNYFNHTIKQYKDNKVIRIKLIDEYGNITEFINDYNQNGKLKYTTLKNPETWKKNENGNWSYGVQDTIPNVFKSSIYENDDKNRLLKRLDYDYSAKNNYEKPILLHQVLYNYEDYKTTVKTIYESGNSSSFIYVYDKKNRIIEYHCCSDTISDSVRIKKYTYKKNQIISLQYISKDKGKTNIQKIDFKYKFDNNFNWIEIIKIVDGKEKSKRTREIEYY
ncbi:hypothetical protein [uncultured Flavobacterium sp.]|uniref:hypothetical protein n=1 Tax=uncultured Flavobacterium sp. TaxID=165435 RepID=UPI0030EB609A|tara:strand:- start:1377 stop:2501 length:1125 start_codon:yes stop_codon:yes gene_type:complete